MEQKLLIVLNIIKLNINNLHLFSSLTSLTSPRFVLAHLYAEETSTLLNKYLINQSCNVYQLHAPIKREKSSRTSV